MIVLLKTGQLNTGTEGKTCRGWLLTSVGCRVKWSNWGSASRNLFYLPKVLDLGAVVIEYGDMKDGTCLAESLNVEVTLSHRGVKWQGSDIVSEMPRPKGLIEWIINKDPVAFRDTFSATLNISHKHKFHEQIIWPSKKLRSINQMSEFDYQFRLTLKNAQYRSLQRRGTRD